MWGGNPDCVHVWGEAVVTDSRGLQVDTSDTLAGPQRDDARKSARGQFCQCGAWLGTLGLEPTPEMYCEHLVEIFRLVRRVCRPDATVWVNLGDSYATSAAGTTTMEPVTWVENGKAKKRGMTRAGPVPGLKPKDLVGIPWMVAFALRADGWWLRSDIIWSKPNPMPESVTDRPTKAHEYLFLLTKSARYFYDADAIREQATSNPIDGRRGNNSGTVQARRAVISGGIEATHMGVPETGRNKRTVWTIATKPYAEAHFATFPPALVEPCIKAGTSEKGCCPECGSPWERVVERQFVPQPDVSRERGIKGAPGQKPMDASSGWEGVPRGTNKTTTIGWQPTCDHYDARYRSDFPQAKSQRKRRQRRISGDWWRRARANPGFDHWPTKPCSVLDMFAGACTVGLEADRLGRDAELIELNPDYAEMGRKRIKDASPMFAEVEVI